MQFELIDLNDSEPIVAALEKCELIGIDTEFMREKTFFAELCLVQMSLGERICCADPLGASDLAAFWDALVACEWVLHSGRQDMEVIFQASGKMPNRLFDTQIAAALLGYAPQLGYAGLVSELFGVTLDKSHTRADWSRRPLPDAVLHYAAEDVEYLLPAYQVLRERLDKLGRYAWAAEDSRDLLDQTLYESDPAQAVMRVKGAANLRGAARAAATRLAAWREQEALTRNRPRQWILRDTVLLEIAQSRPSSMQALTTIKDLPNGTAARSGDRLLEIIAQAAGDGDDWQPPPRPDERQKSLLNKMQKIVSDHAAELGIAAEIIAPKKELLSMLQGRRDGRLFRGWRQVLLGDSLSAVIDRG